MSKFRINYSISVKEIEKARLVEHTNGKTYLNMTMLIDTENPGQYGDHGFTTQQKGKDEPKELQLPILGNAKVVWQQERTEVPEDYRGHTGSNQANPTSQPAAPAQDDLEDIPFANPYKNIESLV